MPEADLLDDHQTAPRRVPIKYKQDGTVLQLHIKQALFEDFSQAKGDLEAISRMDFSQSILARRALEQYSKHLKGLLPDQLLEEASALYSHYR